MGLKQECSFAKPNLKWWVSGRFRLPHNWLLKLRHPWVARNAQVSMIGIQSTTSALGHACDTLHCKPCATFLEWLCSCWRNSTLVNSSSQIHKLEGQSAGHQHIAEIRMAFSFFVLIHVPSTAIYPLSHLLLDTCIRQVWHNHEGQC